MVEISRKEILEKLLQDAMKEREAAKKTSSKVQSEMLSKVN